MPSQEPAATPDDFEAALKELARPPQVGDGFAARLAAEPTRSVDPAVENALRQAHLPTTPQPGDLLEGRYRVLSVLGRGGMGVVVEAEQLRTNKVVAIKWMNAASDSDRSPSQVARFMREARAVANIQHPNVVDLYDVGDSQGTPFLVLERLRGESLRERLQRGPLSWDEAKPIMLGVLQGVAAVHRAGIVHRDLKPDNIFLCADGNVLTPKVLDFGVAAMRATTKDGFDSLTRTGALLGTPSYMALEQLTGSDVDARTDIYALGVTFYEMLTGRLPFEARTAADLAVIQATRSPVFPTQVGRPLTRECERIVLRALARKPEDRFADVEVFAEEISSDHRSPVQPSRSRVAAITLAVLLAVGASAWFLLDQTVRSEPSGTRRENAGDGSDGEHPSRIPEATEASRVSSPERISEPVPPGVLPEAETSKKAEPPVVQPRTAKRTKPEKSTLPERVASPAVEQAPSGAEHAISEKSQATQIRLDDF